MAARAQAFEGYTLYAPNGSRSTYLIDMKKTTVHTWTHAKSIGYSCYLLSDGSLLRSTMVSNPQLGAGGATGDGGVGSGIISPSVAEVFQGE